MIKVEFIMYRYKVVGFSPAQVIQMITALDNKSWVYSSITFFDHPGLLRLKDPKIYF